MSDKLENNQVKAWAQSTKDLATGDPSFDEIQPGVNAAIYSIASALENEKSLTRNQIIKKAKEEYGERGNYNIIESNALHTFDGASRVDPGAVITNTQGKLNEFIAKYGEGARAYETQFNFINKNRDNLRSLEIDNNEMKAKVTYEHRTNKNIATILGALLPSKTIGEAYDKAEQVSDRSTREIIEGIITNKIGEALGVKNQLKELKSAERALGF